jgi:DNA polymerase-3 subunit delta'
MLFKQVAGNNTVKESLLQQVQLNRVSHAQLFFGPEGSGCTEPPTIVKVGVLVEAL